MSNTSEQSLLRDSGKCSDEKLSHLPFPGMWWERLCRPIQAPIKPPLANLNTILNTDVGASMLDTEARKEKTNITRPERDREFLMIFGGDHDWGILDSRKYQSPMPNHCFSTHCQDFQIDQNRAHPFRDHCHDG